MITIERWVAVLIAVVTIVWLALFLRALVFRRRHPPSLTFDEIGLVGMTFVLAVLWTAVAPPWNLGVTRRVREVEGPHGCHGIRERLPSTHVHKLLGEPQRKVLEDDIRGPGAMAWIYDDQRCVVHFMNDRVVAFDEE